MHARPKIVWQDQNADYSQSWVLQHSQNWILFPGLSLKQYKKSSSRACTPWQIYNRSLSLKFSCVVFVPEQPVQS